jgi:hypothetical protein
MANKQRSTTVSFWIPFASQNKKKVGTRIEFGINPNPNLSNFSISRLPEKQKRGDIKIANSGPGMQQMLEKLRAHLQDDPKQVWLYFNVVSELILCWQKWQREV